jgi:hypothetical protein
MPLRNGGSQTRRERLVRQGRAVHGQIELWYFTELVPIVRSADEQGEYEAPLRSPPEHHSPPEYPHLLLGVLDCVVNSTLILLKDIMSTFASQPPQPDEPCSTIDYTITTQNRQQTIQFALGYVRRCSTVAAKPLEFGLQQLWSFRANQGKYIKSTVDQKNEVR